MLLEFEQPIVRLEEKLAEMKELAENSKVNVSEDIKSLEKKIQTLKEETYKNLTRWQRVQLSRHPDRPYTLDYIYSITDDFIELFGDRTVKDDKAMVGGLGTLDGQTVARNIRDMFMLKVPVICIIIGEGASGGALGIAIGDRVLMLENTWYSVISPESCSSILWRSWDYKEQAAEALKLTAQDMKGFGLIDGIIKEPLGGAHRNIPWMCNELKKNILDELKALSAMDVNERIDSRIEKFSDMGSVIE